MIDMCIIFDVSREKGWGDFDGKKMAQKEL